MPLKRTHPIRTLLEEAALSGRLPSRAQLDELEKLASAQLPDGQGLDRFRRELGSAARECADIKSTGSQQAAREHADKWAARFEQRMTPEQRALDQADVAPEDLDRIASRMFSH